MSDMDRISFGISAAIFFALSLLGAYGVVGCLIEGHPGIALVYFVWTLVFGWGTYALFQCYRGRA